MPTRVVNLRSEPYDVYIGRAGYGKKDGTFGNPFPAGLPCKRCGVMHPTPASTIACFAAYFYERVESDEVFRAQVLALKNKTLGCFCRPSPCHGDIIASWLDEDCPR